MKPRMVLHLIGLVGMTAVLAGCVPYVASSAPPTSHPVPPPQVAPPPVSVNVGFFYNSLDPYGDWLWIDPYGWVWAPNAVAPFWRPYTLGRWEWTDWGWMWVSSERWGWATYHYGRWVRAHHHGWVWIPGDVWGPAWVAWRNGPGVVGWAPLPPEVRFHVGIGLDWGGIDFDVAIGLDNWCFVDDVRFANTDIGRYAYPVGRNTTVIKRTKNATRVRVVDGRIVDEGIDRGELERKTQRSIPRRRVVDNPAADHRSADVTTDEIRVFRPGVSPGPPDAAPPRGRKPAATPPPPADKKVESDAERRWDSGWNKDWDKLEKLQKRGEPVATPAPPPPKASPPPRASAPPTAAAPPAATAPPPRSRPESLEEVRDENMSAAENAYRELVAERERAKRQAERGPKKTAPKKGEKGEGKKE
jgi:hypothetical protein